MRAIPTSVTLAFVLAGSSCSGDRTSDAWKVEDVAVPLYHSTTADPETGNYFHVEYVGARLTNGTRSVHLVYRPIDFPNRDPGFSKGDRVRIRGLSEAEDYGALETPDFWLGDVEVAKS